MKKLLLVLLVTLGLQTQAQITCDSITTTYLNISPTTIEVETNVLNLGIPGLILHSWDLYSGCWDAIITYSDTNVNVVIPLPDPIVVDTFILCNWGDFWYTPWTCYPCDTFVWNENNWEKMGIPSNPTSIQQIAIEKFNNNKIYDLLGREIIGDIPNNTMYIRNNKKYIRIK